MMETSVWLFGLLAVIVLPAWPEAATKVEGFEGFGRPRTVAIDDLPEEQRNGAMGDPAPRPQTRGACRDLLGGG
jgi:hypothetical protein